MTEQRRVYVAGAYSADNPIDLFANCRRGIRLVVAVRQMGFAAYNPWADILEHLRGSFTLGECYRHSMTFVEHWAEAIVVEPENETTSKGTQAEVERAEELGLFVANQGSRTDRLQALLQWRMLVNDGRDNRAEPRQDRRGSVGRGARILRNLRRFCQAIRR